MGCKRNLETCKCWSVVSCINLTHYIITNVALPVLSSKVGDGNGVLDVDGELVRVAEDGGGGGQLLVILHWTPSGDLTVVTT